jgi:hypothetical protein
MLDHNGSIIPVQLTVMKDLAEDFMKAGFYEGGFAKFTGVLINTKEIVEVVEKQAFGKDNVKVSTHTIQRKEVTGGSPKGALIENEIDEEEYTQAKSARKLLLEKIKTEDVKKTTNTTVTNPFVAAATANKPSVNPFGGK